MPEPTHASEAAAPPQAHSLAVRSDGEVVPAVFWRPAGVSQGIVLACPGGASHKRSPGILRIVQACLPLGYTVLSVDGPVHGDRRPDGGHDRAAVLQDFRRSWREGAGRLTMARDMRAALDALLATEGHPDAPVGYIGVSAGTAYGIPLLAAEPPRIRVAVLGLWSLSYPGNEHLADQARQVRCDLLFSQQWHDELQDRDGTFALYDAFGSPDKRLLAYPGPHVDLEGERLQDAIAFLDSRLARG